MSRSPMYLTVEETGPPAYRRWRIVDRAGRTWTGRSWSSDPAAGLLYATNRQACFDCQRLLMTEYADAKVRRFVAPVCIDVFGDGEFTAEQLRDWLVRAARLSVSYDGGGFGPLDGSLGVLSIEWGRLKEESS